MTAFPSSTTIVAGSYRAGSASSLRAADGATYQVNAASGRSDWYGRITGVPNSLRSLAFTYTGSSSAACTQRVMLYNWTYGSWAVLTSRTAGTTAATVTAAAGGTLSNYVSGSTGNGDVAVRVQCTSPSYYTAFFTSGDLLKITYGT